MYALDIASLDLIHKMSAYIAMNMFFLYKDLELIMNPVMIKSWAEYYIVCN